MTKKFVLLVCLSLIVFPALIFAEENSAQNQVQSGLRKDIKEIIKDTSGDIKETRQKARDDVKNIRDDFGGQIKDARKAEIQDIKETRQETRDQVKKTRQEMLEKIKVAPKEERRGLRIELRKDFQTDRAQKREELKTVIKEKKNALKEKLQTIKDQRKKQVVGRIDNRIDSINEIRTGRFLKILEKFEDFLDRISARADSLEKEGKDVTNVRSAITKAEEVISASRGVVEIQAGKVYEVAVTTEGKLKKDVGAAVSAMQNDLRTVGETVRKAHDAVNEALNALKSS